MSFTEITGPEYTELLLKRLRGEVPELTWLKQFRNILRPHLRPGVTLLDIGCATGYANNSFREFGAVYTGLDVEPEYLKIAAQWFFDIPGADFLQYDITTSPPQDRRNRHLQRDVGTLPRFDACPSTSGRWG